MPFLIAAGLSTAGSLASGIMGSRAAGNAAKQQQAGFENASSIEQNMFDQSKSLMQPFITGGQNSMQALLQALGVGSQGGATNPMLQMLGLGPNGATGTGIDPATFRASPGYQFQKQEGLDAVTNSAAARGGLGGNALKALNQYGTGMADQSWNQYLQQVTGGWQNLISPLQSLTGLGANMAGNLAGLTTDVGKELGNNAIGVANAGAAGTMGSANALTGMIGSLVGNANSAGMANGTPGFGGGSGGSGGLSALLSSLFGGGGGGGGANADQLAYIAAMNQPAGSFGPAFG